MKKSIETPLYDADLIRAEMGRQQISAARIEEVSRKSTPPGVSVETIAKIRAGRNVKISTLKIVCETLGLELVITKRQAA